MPDDRGGGGVRIISKPATGLLGDADPRDIAGQVKRVGLQIQGACTAGSRLWFPGLRLAFQKGHLAGKTWWAQVGSNHRHLACKAENGNEYAQLSASVHGGELRKPCPEVP